MPVPPVFQFATPINPELLVSAIYAADVSEYKKNPVGAAPSLGETRKILSTTSSGEAKLLPAEEIFMSYVSLRATYPKAITSEMAANIVTLYDHMIVASAEMKQQNPSSPALYTIPDITARGASGATYTLNATQFRSWMADCSDKVVDIDDWVAKNLKKIKARNDAALIDYVTGASEYSPNHPAHNLFRGNQQLDRAARQANKQLQIALNAYNEGASSINEDGGFGEQTYTAVKGFQTAEKLKEDGILGINALTTLEIRKVDKLVEKLKATGVFKSSNTALEEKGKNIILQDLVDIEHITQLYGDKLDGTVKSKLNATLATLQALGMTDTDAVIGQTIADIRTKTHAAAPLNKR